MIPGHSQGRREKKKGDRAPLPLKEKAVPRPPDDEAQPELCYIEEFSFRAGDFCKKIKDLLRRASKGFILRWSGPSSGECEERKNRKMRGAC